MPHRKNDALPDAMFRSGAVGRPGKKAPGNILGAFFLPHPMQLKVAGLLILVLLSPACAGRRPEAVRLTAKDSGRDLAMTVGQDLYVDLAENDTSAIAWRIMLTPDGVLAQAGTPQANSHSELVGSPGIHQFRFTALRPGGTTLTITRRYGDGQSAADSAMLTTSVKVTDG